jgi:membrane protein YdbS with pleckstrin-like domain
VVITLWATGFLTLGILIAWLVSLDVDSTSQATRIVQAVMIADLLWFLPALKMVQSSYRARTYQFDDDEITIKSGWWTESVRHIPLTRVVAFEIRWDRLDRWLEIGTLEVQIASRHHVNGSRVRMTGLANVETVAQLANQLLKQLQNERLAEGILPKGRQERSMISHRF